MHPGCKLYFYAACYGSGSANKRRPPL
ncbi:hypothetical protein CBM2609_A190021 [Cupriavidus taiwanensis]|nr:hypothetical protein CBM2604_A170022 [Cupriavidus taiwanensis]SOZ26329.1 hypothetical protein CBM2609_A190021 [Cupriavidus taiwanensis]SOZ45203.1 hypothetical protein CBM2610_A180022 [Cupriavidus taiwanensis]SOZ58873.1 hypothetical protein CBM2614_A320005 [Cupriavidus taiwanensis]